MDLKDANAAAGQPGQEESFIDKVKDEFLAAEEHVKEVLNVLAQTVVSIAPTLSGILGFVSFFKKDPKAVAAENITQASINASANLAAAYLASGGDMNTIGQHLDAPTIATFVQTLQSHGSTIVPPK